MNRVSPTQLSTFIECNRKWAWQWLAGHKAPQTDAQRKGEKVHKHLEDYVADGVMPDDSPEGTIAKAALEHLPLGAEHSATEFSFEVPDDSILWIGRIDRLDQPHGGLHLFRLVDYKTTSNISYAKQPAELWEDVQALIYAAWFFFTMPDAQEVMLQWFYLQTRGAKKVVLCETTITRAHVEGKFPGLRAEALRMGEYRAAKADPMTLTPNARACGSYGGCPHVERCGDVSIKERVLSVMAQNDLIAKLQAQKTAQGGAPAPAAAPPPPQQPLALGVNPPDAAAPQAGPAQGQLTLEQRMRAGAVPPVTPSAPVQQSLPASQPVAAPVQQTPPPSHLAAVPSQPAQQVVLQPAQTPVIGAPTTGTFGVLLVDTVNVKGSLPATRLADILAPLEAKVNQMMGKPNWRLVDFQHGAGQLAVELAAHLDANPGKYGAISCDGDVPSTKAVRDVLESRAAVVFEGV